MNNNQVPQNTDKGLKNILLEADENLKQEAKLYQMEQVH